MSKEQISTSYLEETKAKYLHNEPYEKRAVVVGSDKQNNIGATIARKLKETIPIVNEYDKDNWRCFFGSRENILVLANGSTHLDWIENQSGHRIGEVLNDCLVTSMEATHHFVKATINTKCPKYIVYIGSMAYKHVLNGSSVYCAAKAGLAHFAKCMAWELAPKNYNVYIVHPSNTEGTPMTEETIKGLMRYRGLNREQAEQYWGSNLPRKNWLNANDIANTIEFLVSGKADYMSGGQIELSGGQR
jgi:NAD(P)-dependent dehydrogenase (short-subunit alcohol dehydrogenase family)